MPKPVLVNVGPIHRKAESGGSKGMKGTPLTLRSHQAASLDLTGLIQPQEATDTVLPGKLHIFLDHYVMEDRGKKRR